MNLKILLQQFKALIQSAVVDRTRKKELER